MKTFARASLLAVLALALVGAAAPKPFSHKIHVEAQEMPCQGCHDTKVDPPALKTKGCNNCHEDGPPPYAGPRSARLSKIKFPHLAHAAKLDCARCHKDVVEEKHAAAQPLVAPTDCAKCHEEKKVAVSMPACARCHGEDLKRARPADHDGAWPLRHGAEAHWRVFGDHGKTCADCHRASTCTSCHLTTEPKSHTGLWRVRTHGKAAGWDRDGCRTCHETGLCVRCHSETKPINHTAGWMQTHGLVAGARTNETCNVCHQTGWCASCHAGR